MRDVALKRMSDCQWNKAHVALTRCRGNRLGIIAFILVARTLAERFDELGRHHARLQAQFHAAATPIVCAAAALHHHDRARRQLRQSGGKLVSP